MEKTYTVNFEDILSFLRNGKDCRVEFYKDGTTATLPIEAQGYPSSMKQEFYVYDYQECDTEKEYKDFITNNYMQPLINDDDDREEMVITVKFK